LSKKVTTDAGERNGYRAVQIMAGAKLAASATGSTGMKTHNARRTETLDYMQAMLGQTYVEISDIIRGERPLRVQQYKRDSAA